MAWTRVLERLERAQELDPWADLVEQKLRPLVGEQGRQDLLTGRWLGHPVHPVLVIMPVSCWTGATLLDLIGGRRGRRPARRLLLVGTLMAAPAAAAGAADWIDTRGAERRVGLVHAGANSVAVALFGLSWWKRRRGGLSGTMLSMLGMAIASGSAYLGGHLSYSRGVGVNTTAFLGGPDDWTEIASVEELPEGQPFAAVADGVPLVACRRGGTIDVLEARCTHRGGPLHEGAVEGECIRCPWHGSEIHLGTGEVMRGPASIPQPAYETSISDGRLRVRRDEPGSLRRSAARARPQPVIEPSVQPV